MILLPYHEHLWKIELLWPEVEIAENGTDYFKAEDNEISTSSCAQDVGRMKLGVQQSLFCSTKIKKKSCLSCVVDVKCSGVKKFSEHLIGIYCVRFLPLEMGNSGQNIHIFTVEVRILLLIMANNK